MTRHPYLRRRMRQVARAVLGALVLLVVLALLTSRAEGQAAPPPAAPPPADSITAALLDRLRVELVRARGFQRASETQLTKVLAIVDSLRARGVELPPVTSPPDSLPPDEPEVPAWPDPPVLQDSIVAWSPIVEPATRDTVLAVGDTIRLRIVAAGVTAITPDGQRVQRSATWDEIRSAGWSWIHSGLAARRDEAPDGTAVTVQATQVSSAWPTTHVSLMRSARVAWRLTFTTVARTDSAPPRDTTPAQIEDPPEPPAENPPVPQPGVGYLPELGASYPCARLLPGTAAAVVGDTIRVTQDAAARERAWCVPYNWPAVSAGDPARARTYPAEPHGERPWYGGPGQPLPWRGDP